MYNLFKDQFMWWINYLAYQESGIYKGSIVLADTAERTYLLLMVILISMARLFCSSYFWEKVWK